MEAITISVLMNLKTLLVGHWFFLRQGTLHQHPTTLPRRLGEKDRAGELLRS